MKRNTKNFFFFLTYAEMILIYYTVVVVVVATKLGELKYIVDVLDYDKKYLNESNQSILYEKS